MSAKDKTVTLPGTPVPADWAEAIAAEAARREGFPELDGPGFVAMFCAHQDATPETIVTRIEFSYDVPADQTTPRARAAAGSAGPQ